MRSRCVRHFFGKFRDIVAHKNRPATLKLDPNRPQNAPKRTKLAPMSANLPSLSPKRRRFVEEYLTDYNATQAAIRAGFSERSAKSQGHRLLTNDDVKAYILAAQAERAKELGFSADEVTLGLLFVAFADVRGLFEVGEDGKTRYRSPEEWPEGLHQAVQGIRIKRLVEGEGADARTFEIVDVRLAPKMRALTLLSKMLGLID